MRVGVNSMAAAVAILAAGAACAADWPQYRGPNVDGSTPEKILTAWPKEGPRVLWKAPLGESFGSFAVAGDKAFIFIERKGDEVCVALDANTGKELWSYAVGKTIFEKQGGTGPRTTPTVDGGRVYVLGTYLRLVCLNAADGKVVWQHDLAKEYGGDMQVQTGGISSWGSACSPLLDGNLVFVNGGGKDQTLLAFDKTTGAVVWKGENELLTHATPVACTIHGERQVIFLCKSGLVSAAAATGKVLWRYPFKFSVSTASTPIAHKDIVYVSAGYNVGTEAARIAKNGEQWTATKLWRQEHPFGNHWTTPVCRDGYLYGIYGFKDYAKPGGKGAPLKCVELETGKEMWSLPGIGSGGGTILVGGTHILAQSDAGDLVLVEADPQACKEVARFSPLGGKCWTMAVVSGGRIYARNTTQGVCLDVTPK